MLAARRASRSLLPSRSRRTHDTRSRAHDAVSERQRHEALSARSRPPSGTGHASVRRGGSGGGGGGRRNCRLRACGAARRGSPCRLSLSFLNLACRSRARDSVAGRLSRARARQWASGARCSLLDVDVWTCGMEYGHDMEYGRAAQVQCHSRTVDAAVPLAFVLAPPRRFAICPSLDCALTHSAR